MITLKGTYEYEYQDGSVAVFELTEGLGLQDRLTLPLKKWRAEGSHRTINLTVTAKGVKGTGRKK